MSIVKTQLDGQNLTLALTAPDTFVDLLAVNIVTGDVTSAWLPAEWISFIKQSVALENAVVPPLDRTSLNYLARLINTLSMDDSVFAGSSVNTAANIYTLRITAVAGVDPAILLVNLPHSITGAFGTADGTQGIAPPVLLAGDVIGASNANQLVAFGPGAVTRGAANKSAVVTTDTKGRVFTLTETSIQIAESQVTDLTTDLGNKADKTITISAGAGLTGGGDLSANRTISMPNTGTAGTYGNSTTVPVVTTDAQGRVTGVTPTAIAFPTSLSPKIGNIAVVDAVNGNNATGSINGLPFLTVEAGLAAITAAGTPATLWIMPGTYTLASATTGLTMPTGCAMRGQNTQTTRIVMNASNPGGTVTMLTMAENSRVEDLNLQLNSGSATTNLVGIALPGTSSTTSKLRTAVLTVDNSGLAVGTTTNATGILSNGTSSLSPSNFSFNYTRGVTVNVFSNGGGTKRGILVSTATEVTFRDTNIYVRAPTNAASTGSYVGVETTNANASAQFRTCSISGPSTAGGYTGSDILQTTPGTGFSNTGIQLGPGCDLINKTAGGKPFTTYVTPFIITYGVNANLAAGARYLWPGVLTSSGDVTQIFQRAQQKSIIQGMSFFVRTAPGVGQSLTVTVLRSATGVVGSGVATAMTQTISGATTLGTQYTVSVDLPLGEFFAIEVSGTAGTSAADLVVQLDLF